jgi:hypothetical protein
VPALRGQSHFDALDVPAAYEFVNLVADLVR